MSVNNKNNTHSSVSEVTLQAVNNALNRTYRGRSINDTLAGLTKKCDLNDEQVAVIAECDLNDEQVAVIADILNTWKPDDSTTALQNLKTRILAVLNYKDLDAVFQGSEQINTTSTKPQVTPQNLNTICFTEESASEFANAHPCKFEFGGKTYPNATICFLAQQYTDQPQVIDLLMQCETAEEALFLSSTCPMTPERKATWENSHAEHVNKNDVMMNIQRAKFGQNPALKEKLIVTGSAYIVCQGYDSPWSDPFNGTGENQLGKFLMQLRGEYGCRGIVPSSMKYNDMILCQKDRCFTLMNMLPAEIIIDEIFMKCFLTGDIRGLQTLARTNKLFNQCVTQLVDIKINLDVLCPSLRILDAEMQGSDVDDEPPINKLSVLRCIKDLSSHVEGEAGLTLLTMCKDRTLKDLVAIAKEAGIVVEIHWNKILEELGDISVEQTYRVMITNNVFRESRNKKYVEQKGFVFQIGCEMPTLQEYVVLCVFTNKLFNQCLYRQEPPTYGRTSTQVGGDPLFVGSSATARLGVDFDGSGFDSESLGAGGRRK